MSRLQEYVSHLNITPFVDSKSNFHLLYFIPHFMAFEYLSIEFYLGILLRLFKSIVIYFCLKRYANK